MKVIKNYLSDFRKKIKPGNVHSPEFADKVEKAFTSRGIQYYCFKSDTIIPYGRYMFMETFIKQAELCMTKPILEAYLDKIESYINGEKGTINLTKVLQQILSMRSRLALTFEIETAYNYASVVYFDQNEDLNDYDVKYNNEKKDRWREDNVVDFFYTRPMAELFGLSSISKTNLEDYIRVQREIIETPTLET